MAEATTLWQLFQQAVQRAPQQEALLDPPNREALCGTPARRLSFSEVEQTALRIAAQWHQSGLRAGDIVLVQLPNVIELPLVYLAAARLGLIVSPVPVQYQQHELRMIIDATHPRAIVSGERFKEDNLLQHFDGLIPNSSLCFSIDGPSGQWQALGENIETANLNDVPTPDQDALFTLCWTSGTTGTPKGVPRRHRHWLAMIPAFEDATALPQGAAMVAPFPMVNMAAISVFLVYWLSVNGKLALHHPLDLPVFLQQIEEEKALYTVAPPALLSLLLATPDLLNSRDLSSLRVIGSGSAPLAPSMISGFKEQLGVDVVNMFGSNEGCCLVSDAQDVPDPTARASLFPRFGAPGISWHNRIAQVFHTRLIDPDSGDAITEAGKAGELVIKGDTVFEGYWHSAEANRELFDAEGYFRTGDLFEITGDNDAFYRFVGRRKDLIVRGGMKISPEEIDQLLTGHPDIQEVAVAPYPDEHLGQRVAAFVVSQKPLTVDDLTAYLEQAGLARFKWPEQVIAIDTLPRNPLNKVLRHELARQLETTPV
ncbi:acyl-CoA synthetase (AMP-forming)/AMP-acid ligase II [Litorivivens lipolytica]|uniref:Acyl-CoA synthetase (AMP-forming)/AMP-acid ligase II n=1 Tax=Litorivivens lipolytica TaxID=1524264 RepID=A0A7W4Z507_9GAMM|nr:class I adenylate-forming enzyme family protein [Litorivivens lipolytica]MBB3047014.1 acyl-CoA synthetase (AMP-forming)/AMP-acid ligase II [Litorivivens lipolytica]